MNEHNLVDEHGEVILPKAAIKVTKPIEKSLSYVQEPVFTNRQMIMMLQNTPHQHVHERPGRGVKTFRYITVSYVTMRLNQIFGWGWSFEIKNSGLSPDKKGVWVEGRLTVHSPDGKVMVTKDQFGSAELKYKSGTQDLVDYADDLKSAGSDALKKCSSMLGIGSDVYADPDTAKEINLKVQSVLNVMKKRSADKAEQEQSEKQ